MTDFPVTERNRLRRLPARGAYDRPTIHEILDAAFICHVGFVLDGTPMVIPTGYARDGDSLILHGSAASRMLRQLSGGARVCVTVSLVDGLVLARSAFHHSINYRSVVLFGTAHLVEEPADKLEALKTFMQHLTPGRWEETREPSAKELKGTGVIRFEIEEGSAKTRSGDPVDDAADQALDAWAGVIPLRTAALDAVPAEDLRRGIEVSDGAHQTQTKWSSV